ncbi:MAG TPA: type III-B CRISPR module RAMP protein Cmr6 [Verrucomicrobiota bacterium]|nr:type III-B CRISPR module RAMP protein Cmr6 [Verrucomicrobiota bacterium]HQB17902.1 type III-B CRISPR module RAMP protein Cmr6 [Verrucomicrobiota bacterium]
MLAVTTPIEEALKKCCDAWHLRLDKFSFAQDGGPEAKTKSLKTVRDCCNDQASRVYLEDTISRTLTWIDCLERQHGDRFGSVELTLDSRLLLHLGRASVLENVGLYAERTTGLPLIPGTALKGVVSTWACWAAHFNPTDGSFREFSQDSTQRHNFANAEALLAERILGNNDPDGSEQAGDVVFVSGFPLTAPKLGLDIVNPHYEADGRDKQNLTPNAFLCVEPGIIWRFVFFVRTGAPDATKLKERTQTWIVEALTQTGIGAKTAAGYGRFRLPTKDDRAAQERRQQEVDAAQARIAEQAELEAKKSKQHDEAQAKMKQDYPNPASFKNLVLNKLNPSQLEQLRSQIPTLQKPENESWREELKQQLASRDYKDIRKRLRGKDWFPSDWLPPQ